MLLVSLLSTGQFLVDVFEVGLQPVIPMKIETRRLKSSVLQLSTVCGVNGVSSPREGVKLPCPCKWQVPLANYIHLCGVWHSQNISVSSWKIGWVSRIGFYIQDL